MAESFNPYHKWLSIPLAEQPPNHYRLLGLPVFESDIDAISSAADRQMAHVRSFQSGPQGELSQRVLNELAVARVTLLTKEKKTAYDAQLRAKIAKQQAASAGTPTSGARPAAPTVTNAPPVAKELRTRPLPVAQAMPAAQAMLDEPPPPGTSAARRKSQAGKSSSQKAALAGIAVVGLLLVGAVAYFVTRGAGSSPPSPRVAVTTPARPSDDAEAAPAPMKATVPATESSPPVRKPAPMPKPAPLEKPIEEPAEQPTPAPNDEAPAPATESTEDAATSPVANITSDDDTTDLPLKDSGALANKEPLESPAHQPVPDEAAQQAAIKAIRDIFKEEYAKAKTPTGQSELARRLLAQGRDEKEQGSERFALLDEARRLANDAGDLATTFEAIDLISEAFEVAPLPAKAEVLTSLGKRAKQPDQQRKLAEHASELLDAALADELPKVVAQLSDVFATAARKSKDPDLVKQIAVRSKQVQEFKKQADAVAAAKKALAGNPDDPESNLALGRYMCLVKNDWHRGLAMLAKSGDSKLQAAAAADAKNPASADDQLKVADAWYEVAAGDKGVKEFNARAYFWYDVARSDLSGLAKARVTKRLDEIAEYARPMMSAAESAAPAGQKMVPALTLRKQLDGHSSHLTCLAFSPNGKTLASGALDALIKLWDTSSGEEIKTLTGSGELRTLVFAPDGRTLISSGADYAGRFWNLANYKAERIVKDCAAIAIAGDGKTVALFNPHEGTTALYDAAGARRTPLENIGRCGPPLVSADGKFVAASIEGGVRVWNAQSGKVMHDLTGHTARLNGMALSPNSKWLASTDNGGVMKIWNLASGDEKHSIKADQHFLSTAAFSPDSSIVVTGGGERQLRFWDVRSGEPLSNQTAHTNAVASIAFSPNGKLLATGSWDHAVKLWDVEYRPLATDSSKSRDKPTAAGTSTPAVSPKSVASASTLKKSASYAYQHTQFFQDENGNYADANCTKLLDGKTNDRWSGILTVGWFDIDPSPIIVDLKRPTPLEAVRIRFLVDDKAQIRVAQKIKVYEGTAKQPGGLLGELTPPRNTPGGWLDVSLDSTKSTRYLWITMSRPDGRDCLFIDEIDFRAAAATSELPKSSAERTATTSSGKNTPPATSKIGKSGKRDPNSTWKCMLGVYHPFFDKKQVYPYVNLTVPNKNLWTEKIQAQMQDNISRDEALAYTGICRLLIPEEGSYVVELSNCEGSLDGKPLRNGPRDADGTVTQEVTLAKGIHQFSILAHMHGQPYLPNCRIAVRHQESGREVVPYNTWQDIQNFMQTPVRGQKVTEVSGWEPTPDTAVEIDVKGLKRK